VSATPPFPDDFLWGAATSAYQIEGSPLADGAGASIWHRFAHTPGRVAGGDTGDVACDHYRRFKDDVAMMRDLGLNAYRFSIAWSRVLPEGTGRVNRKGLDFYERLVDALLEAGIVPSATLYHWDLPAALDDRGGFLNRDAASWLAEYARVVVRALDDRVPMWTTLNEPWVVMDGGYLHGVLAPGHRNLYEAPRVAHHLLLAHAAAVEAYRAEGRHRIGLVVNLEPKDPASTSDDDLAATARAEAYMNRQFLDPVFLGRYPEELPGIYGDAWPEIPSADLERVKAPIDFLGINYYTRGVTHSDPDAFPLRASTVRVPDAEYSDTGWEVRPESLTDMLLRVRDRYPAIPIYLTENGIALPEPATVPDGYEDPRRIAYLRNHLGAVRAARAAGVDVRGYFAWSLLDNFEWSHGFSKRFGLVHVDYRTQKRTPKASARFYAEVIRTQGGTLETGR
jgi:beta-glucosidase